MTVIDRFIPSCNLRVLIPEQELLCKLSRNITNHQLLMEEQSTSQDSQPFSCHSLRSKYLLFQLSNVPGAVWGVDWNK